MKRIVFCAALVIFAPMACTIHADMTVMADAKAQAEAAGQPPPTMFAAKR